MIIKSQFDHLGKTYKVTYTDGAPQDGSPNGTDGVHSFCFYGDKLVVVTEGNEKWTPPGGGIEVGESYEEASIREVKEESNMKVIHQECIGYQDIEMPGENRTVRQFRMFCIVEPYGDFECDPDGDITEIRCIDPIDYRGYIHWGDVGDHLMKRALQMKEKYLPNKETE